MKKIRIGDEVVVITGKEKGQRGKVMKLLCKANRAREMNEFVLVEGLNQVHKHVKPNPQAQIEGGIVRREAPIHASNVQIWNASTGKADKVTIRQQEDGQRVRCYKSTLEVIPVVEVARG